MNKDFLTVSWNGEAGEASLGLPKESVTSPQPAVSIWSTPPKAPTSAQWNRSSNNGEKDSSTSSSSMWKTPHNSSSSEKAGKTESSIFWGRSPVKQLISAPSTVQPSVKPSLKKAKVQPQKAEDSGKKFGGSATVASTSTSTFNSTPRVNSLTGEPYDEDSTLNAQSASSTPSLSSSVGVTLEAPTVKKKVKEWLPDKASSLMWGLSPTESGLGSLEFSVVGPTQVILSVVVELTDGSMMTIPHDVLPHSFITLKKNGSANLNLTGVTSWRRLLFYTTDPVPGGALVATSPEFERTISRQLPPGGRVTVVASMMNCGGRLVVRTVSEPYSNLWEAFTAFGYQKFAWRDNMTPLG